jgi:hypothetical protein
MDLSREHAIIVLMARATSQIPDLEHALRTATSESRMSAFVVLGAGLIDAQQRGQMSLRDVGMALMWGSDYEELQALGQATPEQLLSDRILDLATYLEELPYYPPDRDLSEDWTELRGLVVTLGRRLSDRA